MKFFIPVNGSSFSMMRSSDCKFHLKLKKVSKNFFQGVLQAQKTCYDHDFL